VYGTLDIRSSSVPGLAHWVWLNF